MTVPGCHLRTAQRRFRRNPCGGAEEPRAAADMRVTDGEVQKAGGLGASSTASVNDGESPRLEPPP